MTRQRGKILSMEHVSELVITAFGAVRTGVLAIPNHLAMRMPPEVAREVFSIATDCVNDVLTNLSEGRVMDAVAQPEGAAV